MTARDTLIGNVRAALGVTASAAERRAAVAARLANPTPNVIPARGEGGLETFVTEATRVQADVVRVAALADAPTAIAAYVDEHDLGSAVTVQPTKTLKALPWSKAAPLAVDFDPPSDTVAVGISEAFAGVAETGTLVLLSGQDTPVKLNFLPDTHVVVLAASKIERAYEDVWVKIRANGTDDFMPRTVNFITGPSRTADIEQTLLLGAHGPRRLLIVIVDDRHGG